MASSTAAADPGVVLYRPSLDARSGAGQLLAAQWRGLLAAGHAAVLAGERGAFKFWLRTGIRARRSSPERVASWQRSGTLLVDHGLAVPSADLAFVHNLAIEARRHLPNGALDAAAEREREYFARLRAHAVVVANSRLVAAAIERHFGFPGERIAVLHPGHSAARFGAGRAAELRAAARRELGLADGVPLVGLVTSGDFAKRGLDTFLECARLVSIERPDARFLVVGSKRLPADAATHVLVTGGRVQHRPKGAAPERWLAALDLFVYPARFEEYGLVVAEAQALGVPVLTSRAVGASESLPEVYGPWLAERPDAALFAARAVELLGDRAARRALAEEAAASVRAFDDAAYVRGTLCLVEDQKRRLR
jgi:glycosyltransferase involved in cell wall biosynthesis